MIPCKFCRQPKTGNHYKVCRVLKNVLALPLPPEPGKGARVRGHTPPSGRSGKGRRR